MFEFLFLAKTVLQIEAEYLLFFNNDSNNDDDGLGVFGLGSNSLIF